MLAALMTSFAPPPTSAPKLPESNDFSREAAALRPLVRSVVACVLRERPDHVDVEDCTSEALRRAFETKESRRGEIRPWLLGIARHVALDALRARQRKRAREARDTREDDSEASLIERIADPGDLPSDQLEQAQRARALREALAALPEGPRRALEMFHLEGLGYQEIAKKLGVPLGTVATWVTRGRKAMLATFQEGAWT
jgi:RNA polymerase sigma-70 factor (ECF subfamily)